MYKIVGIENVNYVSKKSGQPVVGMKLYLITDEAKNNLVGNSTTDLFVSAQVQGIPVLAPGDKVNLSFNQYGKVQAIEKIPPKPVTA